MPMNVGTVLDLATPERLLREMSPLLVALALLGAAPALAADAADGEMLAKRWCSECHLVAPDQTVARPGAPSFASISERRRIPEIDTFLKMSHPNMPDMSLTRDEIADLIAWMQKLAPPLDPQKPPPEKDDYKAPGNG